jgi:hypothetical protein
MAKNNKATRNLQETMTTCGLRITEKQQERVQNHEKQKNS